MKQYRRTIALLAICIILTGLLSISRPKKQPKGDYEVFHSFILSADNYKDVRISAVVYQDYHSRELYKRIEEEENRINGTPTKLTIRFYYSREDSKEGKEPYTTISIDYEKNTYEIINESEQREITKCGHFSIEKQKRLCLNPL